MCFDVVSVYLVYFFFLLRDFHPSRTGNTPSGEHILATEPLSEPIFIPVPSNAKGLLTLLAPTLAVPLVQFVPLVSSSVPSSPCLVS